VVSTPAPTEADDGSRYVRGLDGLRALAVLGVIVFHFSRDALPAGFLGVDVFFVVSGYLITTLLLREVGASGRISLPSFWARRARRLLPALCVMTAVVVVASAIDFTDNELHDIRAHALGSLFYCANWVFIHGHSSYFATLGRPSPFLHTWTLAIEEQFYVVFPLVVFAARRVIARRPMVGAAVAFAGAVASQLWMAHLVQPHHDPSRAYFGSDSHASGILVGVALAFMLAAVGRVDRAQRTASAAGVVLLAGVAATMRLADDNSLGLYRGGYLAFALACAALIVVVVQFRDTAFSRALSVGPLVAIGLRSYSLYLWHWPVRVFVTHDNVHAGGAALFVWRAVTLAVLAEVSYRFVERPFRSGVVAGQSVSVGV
jgi:peptidoglycan/LPS O-acetylase OafA/YrhL